MNLPGLYHPDLINAMKQGLSIVMTRDQFIGGEGFADYRDYSNIYSANPEEQWDAVCNYKFPGEAKPDRVEITPDLWLSAATGVHVDCLTGMVNQFLEEIMTTGKLLNLNRRDSLKSRAALGAVAAAPFAFAQKPEHF